MTPGQLRAEIEFVNLWREITDRMERAQRLLETVGLCPELHDAIITEVCAFIELCHALTARTPGCLGDPTKERDAA